MTRAQHTGGARRVLIVKLGAIGDVLMAIPAVDLLRRQLAGAGDAGLMTSGGEAPAVAQRAAVEVDWVIGRSLLPLLAGYSWIRPVVVDEAALMHGSTTERVRELQRLRRALRGRYDVIATLYYDPRYRLLTRSVRARRRVSLSRKDRSRTLLPGRSHSDEFARILLGLPDVCRDRSLRPVSPDALPASPLRPRSAGRRRIALVPAGASNMMRQQTLRRWPLESYVALASALIGRGDEIVLLGGPDDVWALPSFEHLPLGSVIDAVGQLALPEVIAALNTCDAVVSHDTGPMHLAGLSTAAVIALFGPTDPGSFLPRRPGVWSIWGGEGFACRPCYDGSEFAPCPSNGCMQQIAPAAVLRLLDRALAAREAAEDQGTWPRLFVPSQLAEAGSS